MRKITGTVTSTKMDKTVVVTVHSYKSHPKYKKKFRTSKKYFADNPENKQFEIGDSVTIFESRPLSKLKRWTLTGSNTVDTKKEADESTKVE